MGIPGGRRDARVVPVRMPQRPRRATGPHAEIGLALFGKKKDDASATEASPTPTKDGPPPSHPEKAKRFFDHARTVQQAGNFEYAMQNWLGGLRQDPYSMDGLEGFWSAATAFVGESGKLSKETSRAISGKSDLDKWLSALLSWGVKPMDGSAATRAAELGARLQLTEPTYWIAERALMLTARDPKKAKKDAFLKLMEVFESIGAFERAAQAGDFAVKSDPGDSELATRVRNFTAQATIRGGGFDNTGEQGGFRANLRDADKQRLLEESERVVKTEETVDRLVAAAEAEFAKRPEDIPTLRQLVKRLRERGRPEDEERALKLLAAAYESTKQFAFRQEYEEIQLRRAKRQLMALKRAAEANPEDETAAQRYEKGRLQYTQMEIKSLKTRVENYPTDLKLKFELGKRHFELGQHEEAIALFQEAKNDSKNRAAVMRLLGESFRAMGWMDEAIDTFRAAIAKHDDHDNETGMALRYGLMLALEGRAREQRDADAAQEADRLASAIAIQQINYRDIRERRDAIKKLIAELRQA